MKIFLACLIGAAVATAVYPTAYIPGLILGAFVAFFAFKIIERMQTN